MTWMVTGGAGYIGSHVVAAMRAAGQDVVVLDDLSSGVPARVGDVPLVVAGIADGEAVARTICDHGVRGVVHLAVKKQVEESIRQPLLCYRKNVEGLRAVLEAVTAAGVEQFVLSSSAAVHGAPDVDLVDERTECLPVNPYGRTKLIGEQMLADVAPVTGLRYAAPRYFNVAAAAALGGGRVHALTANIGRGEGMSVREMVETIRRVTGAVDEPWCEPVVAPRRPGDPARVVASAELVRRELGWSAAHGVEEMVASAWEGWQAQAALTV